MAAIADARGLFIAADRNTPNGGIVAILFVIDGDLDKGHTRSVRRNLGIANPVELKQVFLSDRTLLGKPKKRDKHAKTCWDQSKATAHGSSSHVGLTVIAIGKRECLQAITNYGNFGNSLAGLFHLVV